MPQTRTASRVQAADDKDCPPHRLARFFDAQAGFVPRSQTRPVINPRPRYIKGAQRVQLRGREAGAEILPRLPHPGGNRATPLHDRERIDGPVWPRRTAGIVPDWPLQALDHAVIMALWGRRDIAI
jgi:hypothetical protein